MKQQWKEGVDNQMRWDRALPLFCSAGLKDLPHQKTRQLQHVRKIRMRDKKREQCEKVKAEKEPIKEGERDRNWGRIIMTIMTEGQIGCTIEPIAMSDSEGKKSRLKVKKITVSPCQELEQWCAHFPQNQKWHGVHSVFLPLCNVLHKALQIFASKADISGF